MSYCPVMKFVWVTPGWYSVTGSNFLARSCCGYSSRLVIAVVNPLPDDKILGLAKLKAFADEK